MQFVPDRVEEHAVDGEVAALGVLFGRGERDGVRSTAVDVRAVGAERRHLDGEPFAVSTSAARTDDLHHAEVRADLVAPAEQRAKLFRPGGRSDVVILRARGRATRRARTRRPGAAVYPAFWSVRTPYPMRIPRGSVMSDRIAEVRRRFVGQVVWIAAVLTIARQRRLHAQGRKPPSRRKPRTYSIRLSRPSKCS